MNKLFYFVGVVVLGGALLVVYLATATTDENPSAAPAPSSEPGIRIIP